MNLGIEYLQKVMDFCLLRNISAKNIDRNIIKGSVVNTAKYLFIMLNNLVQMHVKLVQKEQLQKYQKKMVI